MLSMLMESNLLRALIVAAIGITLRDTFSLPRKTTPAQLVGGAAAVMVATALSIAVGWIMIQSDNSYRLDFVKEFMVCASVGGTIYFVLRRQARYNTTFWQGVEHTVLSFTVGIHSGVCVNILIGANDFTLCFNYLAFCAGIGTACVVVRTFFDEALVNLHQKTPTR